MLISLHGVDCGVCESESCRVSFADTACMHVFMSFLARLTVVDMQQDYTAQQCTTLH